MISPAEIERQHRDLMQVSPLQSGGQKDVYRAIHREHGCVAVKVIKSPGLHPRTDREIAAIRRLASARVPRLFDVRTISDLGGTYSCLVEQFIDGDTLRSLLTRGSLPVNDALELMDALLSLCVELEVAHLVHRDVKPENIMRDRTGQWWVLDLGIARHLDLTSLTDSLEPFGPHTAGYAAPEQFRNRKWEVDIRADLFSVGVVSYEALAGSNPFSLGARDHMDRLRRTETINLPLLQVAGDSQRQLASFIGVLTAKFPSRRPRTAHVALEWFQALRPTVRP